MADETIELLETCRVAEDIWEHLPEPTSGLRAEIDLLWKAYEQMTSSAGEDMGEYPAKLVALSANLRSASREVTHADVRTDVLLGAWRDAEHALSQTDPGTLSWLVACRAVEATRDAYHARVDAVQRPRREERDPSPSTRTADGPASQMSAR